jgi:protein TonB
MRPEPNQVLEVPMFEESMVESFAIPAPETRRWTMAASLFFQISVALVLATLPLLYPESLTSHLIAPLVFTPPPPRVPVPIQQSQTSTENSAQSTTTPIIEHLPNPLFSSHRTLSSEDAPVISQRSINMGDAIPSLVTDQPSHSPSVSAAPVQARPKPVRVSQLSPGMLLTPIRPVYPAIARAAGVSGQVVVSAVISNTGTIESLQVSSGPELLRRAALDAIQAARYRPFLLNGQPVEVQTTITVSFRLGE